jgi:phosphoglycolate phosphatase
LEIGVEKKMNLLFDLDGTLTDPFAGITRCILYACDQLSRNCPPGERLRWCIGPPLRDSFAKLLASDEAAQIEKAVAYYRERFGTVGLFENEVYDGIPKMLESLREEGHTLYVATSKPTFFARKIIDHFGLQPFFKCIYGSELDGTRGDKTSLIAHILQTEAFEPSEAAMIGDRENDMIGAKENGMPGYGVLWGYGSMDELQNSGARAFFTMPHEVVTAFNGQSSLSLQH